jgi:MarR family 2-MHQ and catechol resistance regulon transcriptional repressor
MHRKDSGGAGGVHLWLILWKAFTALQQHALKSIERLGLGYSDFGVLEVVLHKGPTPVNTIGEKVNLTSGSISVAVDRLEERGLVERRPDKADRRARVVHLTAAGRKLIERAFKCHEAAMERATSGLSEAERELAMGLLRKLGKAAAELSPGERE